MIQRVRADFLNFQPDVEDLGNSGLTVATNVLHDTEGYKQVRNLATASSIIGLGFTASWFDAVPLGNSVAYLGVAHRDSPAAVQIGTVNVWSEYSTAPSGGATAGALHCFSAVELGPTIVATAKYSYATTAPTQTGTAAGYISYSTGLGYGSGSTYTDLPNSATGIVCGVINQFVFVGNEDGPEGVPANSKVRWCAIGDATDWPTPNTDDARAKQAGEQQLNPRFGAVTGIAGDDFFGYIFQERAITKATYVGGDVVFTFDTFEEDRGCGYLQRFVAIDDAVYFESKTNRHVLINGQITDIGYGRVDDSHAPTTDFYALKKNPAIHTVFFSNSLAYNYKTNQWTRLPTITPVLSINDKTGIIGQFLTDRVYDSTGGAVQTAVVESGSADLNQGGRSVITSVRPLVNGGTSTVRVGAQDDLDDAVTYSTVTSVTARTGKADFRDEGRYHRVEVTVSGDFTTIQGVDIEYSPQGQV